MPYTIRNIIFSFFGVFSALIVAAPSFAVPLTVSYGAIIGFDPTATVGTGGENAQTLIDELFGTGIGSTGLVSVTGSFA
ncbi:hypothetical protein [Nitrosococcus watsonii]|uniref:Uncharacterized protein n=1 Tax=Nitrosococcus watsoni (strain C-113) TaxID=105559 RepID=D8K4D3_NITWC|nr:hypothetical protein [Nitrosococcus watsonii]ADJ27830.1 hypothetical protein Nwat_0884 [Nitrosococcus watsonii C-113]